MAREKVNHKSSTRTKESSERRRSLTAAVLRSAAAEGKIEARLKAQIGQMLTLQEFAGQFARLLSMVTPSDLDTPGTEERLLLAFSEMETLLQSSLDRQRELTNICKRSSQTTPEKTQPDMFGGLGHFDLEGVYHFD
jgi:hypothetical protein